jgi:hypothetical protein
VFLGHLLFAFLLCLPAVSWGRVFDFKELRVASLLRGSAGPVAIGQQAYGNSSGRSTTFDSKPDYALSGEVGAVFLGEEINLTLSAEYLTPTAEQGIKGTRYGSTELMSLDSHVYALIGWVGAEFLMRKRPHSRIFWGIYGGYASIDLINVVRLTDNGRDLYPNSGAAFEERGSGSAFAAKTLLGWEFLILSHVALALEVGYRYLVVSSLTHTTPVETPAGSFSKGAPMRDNDGLFRGLNLSGFTGGLNLRFYFN